MACEMLVNPHTIKRLFPHASAATLAANAGDYGTGQIDPPHLQFEPALAKEQLTITITGQVRGGKNAMGVTKSGRHYAKAPFKKWRADAANQVHRQVRAHKFTCITEPTNIRVDYVAGDRKRRDQTGIFDALFHLLEYCGVVHDDSLLWVTASSRSYDKSNPRVTITIIP